MLVKKHVVVFKIYLLYPLFLYCRNVPPVNFIALRSFLTKRSKFLQLEETYCYTRLTYFAMIAFVFASTTATVLIQLSHANTFVQTRIFGQRAWEFVVRFNLKTASRLVSRSKRANWHISGNGQWLSVDRDLLDCALESFGHAREAMCFLPGSKCNSLIKEI